MPLKYSLGGAAFACLALLSLAACKDENNALLETSAGKLAAIDSGTTSITEKQVRPYTSLLTKLEAKCDDTRNGISDTAVQAKNIFQSRKGIEVSSLAVLQMIDDAVPEGVKLNCDEVMAAIITLS
jgi:hypothetical protein